MNDYEAHLSSYDHSHKQRLKDMKAMVRDPNAGAKARKAEAKADGMVSIKLSDQETPSSGGSGFKKGGFKKTGFKSAFAPIDNQAPAAAAAAPTQSLATESSHEPTDEHADALEETEKRSSSPPPPRFYKGSLVESDTEDEGYEVYDPRFPTD